MNQKINPYFLWNLYKEYNIGKSLNGTLQLWKIQMSFVAKAILSRNLEIWIVYIDDVTIVTSKFRPLRGKNVTFPAIADSGSGIKGPLSHVTFFHLWITFPGKQSAVGRLMYLKHYRCIDVSSWHWSSLSIFQLFPSYQDNVNIRGNLGPTLLEQTT